MFPLLWVFFVSFSLLQNDDLEWLYGIATEIAASKQRDVIKIQKANDPSVICQSRKRAHFPI